jgi:TolB protein
MKEAFTLIVLFCLALGTAAVLAPAEAHARVYIDITKPFSRKLPLALPEYASMAGSAATGLGSEGSRLLANDLTYTGHFDILDPKTYLGGADQVNPRMWRYIGAELLVTCSYTQQGDAISLEMRLHDVTDGRLMVGRRYDGLTKDLSAMMHRFADEIMQAVTGERSVFSTAIAFVRTVQGGNKEIWLMNFDGTGARQFTHRGDITLYPSWSPDGALIAYTSYVVRRPAAFVQAINCGEGRIIYNKPGVNLTPVFMPTGGQVAVTLSHTGKTNIYLGDLTGNLGPNLTDGWGIEVSPTFSPDGNKMAFVSDRGGSPHIYVRDMISGAISRLSFGQKYCAAPDWSPRGDRIAYQAQINGVFQVATIKPDGSEMRIITNDHGGSEDPSWSPDGRLIAYASRNTGRYQIYVMTAAGQSVRRLTDLAGENTDPAWSPRGVVGK